MESILDPKKLYDIELIRDVGDFKKGTRIRGQCANTNDFSRFKRWWMELNDINNLFEADDYTNGPDPGALRRLYKLTFKTVIINN